jgi:Leucine-rich repeat (LRR) protein
METLQLSSQKLTSFEPTYAQLKLPRNFRHLDLSHNRLKDLPPNLSKLINVASVNLIGNPIKKVS